MFSLHPTTLRFIKSYLIALVLFGVIDTIWLGFVANGFYSEQLGSLMAPEIRIEFAVLFYLMYPLAVTVLAVLPTARAQVQISGAFFRGAVLGLASYGTYDLTNAAVLKDWPMAVTYVDIIWGTLLTALVSLLTATLLAYRSA